MTFRRVLLAAGILLVLAATAVAIAARVLLSGQRVKAAVEQQASAALGRPVSIASARPRVFPRVGLDLADVAIGSAREVALRRVVLSTGLGALLGRRVEDAELLIDGSRIDLKWALALLASVAQPSATTAAAPGGGSSAITIVSITTIRLREVDLVAGGRTVRVNMDSALTGDRLVILRMGARSDGSDLHAAGELSSLAARTGKFTVNASALDIDGLLTFMAAATPTARTARGGQAAATGGAPADVSIAIRATSGRVAGAALSDLSATGRVKGSDARLDDLRSGIFGGAFEGSVAVFGSGAEPRYEWRGSFDRLDAEQLAAFAGTTGSMTGRLGGTLAITSSGPDPESAIRRARGNARIVATDGRIPGLEIVRTVILAFGKPTGERPPGSGEAFSRIAATFAIANQRLTTNDLTFASRDFDMTAAGTLFLASQALDFRADVVLSRELSAQAGRDLYRLAREDDRIVLPARIGGTVVAPTVFIDIEAALERALRNRAKDELNSLFDKLRKRIIK